MLSWYPQRTSPFIISELRDTFGDHIGFLFLDSGRSIFTLLASTHGSGDHRERSLSHVVDLGAAFVSDPITFFSQRTRFLLMYT